MYYYTFKYDSLYTREYVCEMLECYGFTKDKFCCELKDSKGIGLVFHCVDDSCSIVKCRKYVLLSEHMMSKDPTIGWVEPYRKEVKNLQEFLDICSNLA